MHTKKILLLLIFSSAISCFAQTNFTYTPAKPKAGDLISITYSPSGDIANTKSPITATVSTLGSKGQNAKDLDLKKSGNSYSATVKTDTSDNFVFFSFSADKNFDNNFNNGYWIQLYDGDKIKSGSDISLSQFYQFGGRGAGVDANNDKALQYMEQEFTLYPEMKKPMLISYARLYSLVKKDDGPAMIQKEIESTLKDGLKDETDYSNLKSLYTLAKLPQQSAFITTLMKEKFPNGKWQAGETIQAFFNETDINKKEQMLDEITAKIKDDPNWKYLESSLPFFKSTIPAAYAEKKDWDGMKKAIKKYDIKGGDLASLYNNTSWEMQKTGKDLKEAEDMSATATHWAKDEWKKPSGEKPAYLTETQWEKSRANVYGMYADTYGMIMYKEGNYKKGLPYSEDAALKLGKGLQADENTTYALLAEKTLPEKKYVKQLEQFVKDGKSTSDIKDILKRAYVKNHQSEKGFDDYIAALEKESYLKIIDELKKGMLQQATPSFALMDLSGKKINISDLKDKIVVVDFWATWCGPCKASFPGMQKMIAKYKSDPDVQFVFVDTWETADKKEKNAEDFIVANKYDFHVLMDNDNKVVDQFNVSGIPTKFVIDKAGNIRFKAIGFDGSDDKLITELSAMIDMAKEGSKKM